jgi:hypothetical protein
MFDPVAGGVYPVFGTPRGPHSVTVTRGDGRVRVSWTPPPDEGGAPLTGYVVSWDDLADRSGSVTVDAGQTSRVVTGLENGVNYLFTVASVSEVGTGPTQSSAWATPAPPPTNGVVTRHGPFGVSGRRAVALAHGTPAGTSIVAAVRSGTGAGAWTVTGKGKVYVHGDAQHAGDIPVRGERVTDLRVTATGDGYWIATVDGDVYARGDAQAQPALPASRRTSPIVAMDTRADGTGYWLLASNGRVHNRGSAPWFCNGRDTRPFVAMARTANGNGYWLVTDRGRVHACGNARSWGSAPAGVVVAGIVPSPSGRGYTLVTDTGRAIPRGEV